MQLYLLYAAGEHILVFSIRTNTFFIVWSVAKRARVLCCLHFSVLLLWNIGGRFPAQRIFDNFISCSVGLQNLKKELHLGALYKKC